MPPSAWNSCALLALALVDEDDLQALGQERRLAQALREGLRRELELLEDVGVGQEGDRRPGLVLVGLPDLLELGRRLAARELLPVDLAVAPHLGHEPLGERVHDRDADAVQAAGHLVALAAELPAGVELRQDDREGRQALVVHDVDRDARAPVANRDRVVGMKAHLDALVPAREGLVDRVVDDLVDEVVEAARARRADVHARAQANGLEALENGDVLGVVTGLCHKKIPANGGFLSRLKSIRTAGRPGARLGDRARLAAAARRDGLPRDPGSSMPRGDLLGGRVLARRRGSGRSLRSLRSSRSGLRERGPRRSGGGAGSLAEMLAQPRADRRPRAG